MAQGDGEAERGAQAASRLTFWRLTPENAWRRNLYVVMLAVFVSFTGFTFVMPFLPLYIKQLGVTDTGNAALWSGFIFGISPLISGLLAPVWSVLSERYGRKVMLQRSLGAFVILIVLMAFVTNIYQLVALRLMIGFFGGMGAMSVALASTIAPRHQVGEAVGLIQATQLSSGIAAPFIGGVLVDAFGLNGSFYIASALCAIAFFVITFAYRDEDEQGEGRAAEATTSRSRVKPVISVRDYLHMPIFIGLLVAVFTIQFVDRSFGPLLPLYISTLDAPGERIGSITGLVMTLGAIAASFTAVQAGRLSSRVEPRPLLIGSLIAGAILCLPLAFVNHWVQLLVIRFLLGLLAGGALTLAYAIGGREMPAGAKMGVFGTLAGIGQVGGAISPFVTGALSKWASLSAIFIVDAVLYVLLVGWVWAMLRRQGAATTPSPPAAGPAAASEAALAEADD
jgi:DHA1 family multidrug resistance protein-like MFS transporter